jgi:hypothetical protein
MHLERCRISHEKMTGEGQRLGVAYRLKTGELVYVPDEDHANAGSELAPARQKD